MLFDDIFLSLGSNQGDRIKFLEKAVQQIGILAGSVVKQSAVYETAAWGNTDMPSFLNQVIAISSVHPPEALLSILLGIEQSLGRIRTDKRWEARTMDIDILFFNQQKVNSPELRIPHPELIKRKFVLAPLAEIAGGFIHPEYQQTIHQLLLSCPDKLSIQKIS
jgi:2-amino-4-hydroxy-6-hydroxymethyldihydropteridine diphosphokinase